MLDYNTLDLSEIQAALAESCSVGNRIDRESFGKELSFTAFDAYPLAGPNATIAIRVKVYPATHKVSCEYWNHRNSNELCWHIAAVLYEHIDLIHEAEALITGQAEASAQRPAPASEVPALVDRQVTEILILKGITKGLRQPGKVKDRLLELRRRYQDRAVREEWYLK